MGTRAGLRKVPLRVLHWGGIFEGIDDGDIPIGQLEIILGCILSRDMIGNDGTLGFPPTPHKMYFTVVESVSMSHHYQSCVET